LLEIKRGIVYPWILMKRVLGVWLAIEVASNMMCLESIDPKTGVIPSKGKAYIFISLGIKDTYGKHISMDSWNDLDDVGPKDIREVLMEAHTMGGTGGTE